MLAFRVGISLALLLSAPALLAATAARDLAVPIAGRGVGSDGRPFETALWITNVSADASSVTLSYLRSARPNETPHATTFTLRPGETRLFDPLGAAVTGVESGTGGLLIHADEPVTAVARIYAKAAGEPLSRMRMTTITAIPTRYAVANGGLSWLQGYTGGSSPLGYRLYVVETRGEPLYYTISLLDDQGRTGAQKGFYIAGREQRSLDLRAEFPGVTLAHALVRVRGLNGNGRVVFTGLELAPESRDAGAYEMSFLIESRNRLSAEEIIAYAVIAAALIAIAVASRRRTRAS
jgi:hypothetical protein